MIKNKECIYGSFSEDFFKIFLIFPIAIIFTRLDVEYIKYFAIVSLIFFDYSHIFYTINRIKNKNDLEYIKPKLKKYLIISVIVVLFSLYISFNLLIAIAIYYNLYHILRQHEGILKWYLKKTENNHQTLLPNIMKYLIVFFLASLHFRKEFFFNIFSGVKNKSDFIFYFPSLDIHNLFYIISICLFLFFLIYIIVNLVLKKNIIANIYGALVVSIYFFSIFITRNVYELYIIHALIHGFHYINIVNKSVTDIKNINVKKGTFIVFLIISILFYFFEELTSEYLNIYIFYLLYLVPQWIHYYLDRILWKKGNVNWQNSISK